MDSSRLINETTYVLVFEDSRKVFDENFNHTTKSFNYFIAALKRFNLIIKCPHNIKLFVFVYPVKHFHQTLNIVIIIVGNILNNEYDLIRY